MSKVVESPIVTKKKPEQEDWLLKLDNEFVFENAAVRNEEKGKAGMW